MTYSPSTALALALLSAGIAAAEPRILVYGDSNTWGWVPAEAGFPSTRHPDSVRWPGVMESALEDAVGDATIVVDGLSGRTVNTPYPEAQSGIPGAALSGLEDVRGAVASALPLNLVVVMLGTNDARSDLAVAPAAAGANMARLVDEIRSINGGVATSYPAPSILVVAPPAIGDTSATPISGVTEGSQERRRAVSASIIAAGAASGLDVFDASEAVTIDSIDRVHITAQMHDALGRAVAAAAKERLGPAR
ncbi:GDSL-type esterase/lipase family protein [Leisingera sp. ANG-M7]|uniref:GDSL-type esterase/lipase family protein n=1 Tax=Leisingera sp. ANG-M7 TaxID=1577902 RepID=UPI00068C28E8|nr:GDSL-type esterase/lipase family protein [Leisingera sp. ANG-M7]